MVTWIKTLKQLLPYSLTKWLKSLRKLSRRKQYEIKARSATNVVSVEDIANALSQLGIAAGDDLLLHSAMRGLGVIEGGAEGVLVAIRNLIGEQGTLLVPAYPMSGSMLEHLQRERIALDALNSPSHMGKITELLRKLPGARRSLHPTHSIAAIGPRAEFYTATHHHSQTPCGPGSPFHKLIETRGFIVAFGSPIGKITSYHVLEDTESVFPFDVYLPQVFPARMIDEAGKVVDVNVKCHDPRLSPLRIDNNRAVEAAFERLLQARGILSTVPLGEGRVWAMRADSLQDTLKELLNEGVTIYDASRARV